VEPAWIGRGVGAQLWAEIVEEARRLGWSALEIVADPKAEGFYLRMGARRTGQVPSKYMAGLLLPVLELRLLA
jgi:predicted N-acetyltransferase YhbS